nr:MAG TPA: hypothetical protein [Caudoviricetes sp.]
MCYNGICQVMGIKQRRFILFLLYFYQKGAKRIWE